MKLFVFRPKAHGEFTFSTLADNERQAFEIIDLYIKRRYWRDHDNEPDNEAYGWNTDYYELEVYEHGEVCENPND